MADIRVQIGSVGYSKHPPDPTLLAASEQLAAETLPEW